MLLLLVTQWVSSALPSFAQVDDPVEAARQAIEVGEFFQAIEILTPQIEADPTPDVFLYLGIAYANIARQERSLELFTEAAGLYPDDPRFHNETAGIHLSNRDIGLAVEALNRALSVAPSDSYAADLLASIRMSEGDVREALEIWNNVDQPRLDQITQNFSPGFIDSAVPRALAFDPGDVLTYGQWRTTESRLFTSRLFSNVGLELEPSPSPDLYDAIVRTSPETNTGSDILFDLFRGLPVETAHLEFSNIGFSGISWKSSYRWDEDRRRLIERFLIPLPVRSLPLLEIRDVWRSENWDLTEPIREEFASDAAFHYKVNSVGLSLSAIPHYRFEVTGGFEYRNRDATGSITQLGMDERNSATLSIGAVIRPLDGRYKNQIRLDGFLARNSLLGDFDFSGGTAEFASRLALDEDSTTLLDWSVTAGTSRGELPVDHYFVLGLGSIAQHPLRAHVTSDEGRYGRAPMGTDFVLVNSDLEHRLATVPMFNALSIPYVEIKAIGFFDAAKTFDRQRIFEQGEWLKDVGAGLRFETPNSSVTFLYGRDITGERNSFYFYTEQRFW